MNIKHLLAASALIVSANSFAQSTFEEGGLVYMEDLSDPSKMAVIVMPNFNMTTGQNLYSGNVVVPASIEHDLDTYEVVGLSASSFYMCPGLTGLEIQAPLKTLSMSCIYGDNIKKIKLPDTLEELPNSSIIAPNVEEIYFGKSLKSVESSCPQLKVTELNIPVTIENISHSFAECPLVKTLHLKGGNLSTLSGSFAKIPILESLSIEGKDLTIDNCFWETGKLQTINLSGVIAINSSFHTINIDKLVIPEGITEINSSFHEFNGSELTLPKSLKKMNYSFGSCPNLKTAHLSKGVCSLGDFYNVKGVTLYCPWDEVPKAPYFSDDSVVTFVVPKGMEAKYREAWADNLKWAENASITFREENF